MPGKLLSWPDWPEFTAAEAERGDDLVGYKKAIVDKYGRDNIIKSWLKVCKELESVTDHIAEQRTSAIPEVKFEEVFDLSPERKQGLKDAGCFVVRGVFSRTQADEWFKNLKDYIAANKASVEGLPLESVGHKYAVTDNSQAGPRRHLSFLTCTIRRPKWRRAPIPTNSSSVKS